MNQTPELNEENDPLGPWKGFYRPPKKRDVHSVKLAQDQFDRVMQLVSYYHSLGQDHATLSSIMREGFELLWLLRTGQITVTRNEPRNVDGLETPTKTDQQ